MEGIYESSVSKFWSRGRDQNETHGPGQVFLERNRRAL